MLISVGSLTEAERRAMDHRSRKRPFSEVLQLGIRKRKRGSYSRERKRCRVCREEGSPCCEPIQRLRSSHIKKPFTETAEDIESPQETPSNKMRMSTAKEAPRTSAVYPAPVVTVQRKRWKNSQSKTFPVTEEVRETEKVSLNRTWIIGSNYIRRYREITEDTEAPRPSAVDPAPVVRVQRKRWKNSQLKTFPVTEEVRETEKVSPNKTWIIGSNYIRRYREINEDTEAPRRSAVDPAPVVRVQRKRWKNSQLKTFPDSGKVRMTGKVFLKKIWIIGSSYIHRGEKAAFDCFGENFGLVAKVQWFGKGGLRWTGVLPRFYSELSTQGPPDILVIHAGGNDLGLTPAKQLAAAMTRGLIQLHQKFPKMKILLSSINERQAWRYGEARIIDNDRRTVNQMMAQAAHQFGGEVIQHPLLRSFKKQFYLPDGVHFTPKGNHVFLSVMHGVLRKVLLLQRLN